MRRAAKRDASEPEIVYGSKTGNYTCLECGIYCRGRVVEGRGKYCSRSCQGKHYETRYRGAENPNFKGAGIRSCEKCNGEFQSYSATSKYCSSDCYNAARAPVVKVKPERPARISKPCPVCNGPAFGGRTYCTDECRLSTKTTTVCPQCLAGFRSPPSAKRVFCSYPCFVANGGTVRAGLRSAEIIMKKYGAKKDANHGELMKVLKQFCAVHDLSHAGFGVPDGVAYVQGNWHLFDIKNLNTSYGRRGLNKRQKEWVADWRGGPVYLIHDEKEAMLLAKGHFERLTKVEAGTAIEISKGQRS